MFKQWFNETNATAHAKGETYPRRQDRIVFYTTFWTTIVVVPLTMLGAVVFTARSIVRKAF